MALFMPSDISPDNRGSLGNGTVDISDGLRVTWTIQGNAATPMTAYRIKIMLNDVASTLVYDTGKVTQTVYGTDALGNPIPFSVLISAESLSDVMVNGEEYKLTIQQWWNNDDSVTQQSASVFVTRDAPELSIDAFPAPLANKSYTFTASYAQAQGDPLNYIRWRIAYADDTDNPIYDSGNIFGTALLQTMFDGFFSGESYAIRCNAQTVNGVEADTGWEAFSVLYETAKLNGLANASCTAGRSAVKIDWSAASNTPGKATGDYTIENGWLSLPQGSSVLWNMMNGQPFAFKTPWAIIVRVKLQYRNAFVFQAQESNGATIALRYNLADRTLELLEDQRVLETINGVFGGEEFVFALTPNAWYICYYTVNGLYPETDIYPATTLYPGGYSEFRVFWKGNNAQNPLHKWYETYTQYPITSVRLLGAARYDYVQILDGTMSDEAISDLIDDGIYVPSYDEATHFLAGFESDLSAGNLPIGDGELAGMALYRQKDGVLSAVLSVKFTYGAIYDYSARSGETYTYYAFMQGEDRYVAMPIISNEITPCWANWTILECEEQANDVYRVVSEYRFNKNMTTSAISNNNAPSVLNNFTRYPIVQRAPQNYQSGTLTALIGVVENGEYTDTKELRDKIWELSTTNRTLFLKNKKGDLLKIAISAPITMQTGDNTPQQIQTAAIPWVEIGKTDGLKIYATEMNEGGT